MKLYQIQASNWEAFFGTIANPITRDVTVIAQTPSCDAFLLLSKDAQDGLALKASVPTGFDFTYCQEWGLTINDAVVDRVVLDLRKKAYPSWQDQMDMQYWDKVNNTSTWQDAVQAVKDKYPKETE